MLLGIFALSGIARAQSDDAAWNEVVKKANAEGKLNLYFVAPPGQSQRVIDAFQKQYPAIKVNFVRGVADLLQGVNAERASGVDGGDVRAFVKEMIQEGAPVAYVVSPKTFAIQWAAGVLANSKRPNVARVFMTS
jgi:ABC-type glycerol-3-phosphate transport system substrate-binding protein